MPSITVNVPTGSLTVGDAVPTVWDGYPPGTVLYVHPNGGVLSSSDTELEITLAGPDAGVLNPFLDGSPMTVSSRTPNSIRVALPAGVLGGPFRGTFGPADTGIELLLHADNNHTDNSANGYVNSLSANFTTTSKYGSHAFDTRTSQAAYPVPTEDCIGDLMVEMYIYATSTPVGTAVFAHQFITTDLPFVLAFGETLGSLTGSNLYAGHYDVGTGWYGVWSTWTPTLNTYHFIRAKVESDAVTVWVDGVQRISGTFATSRGTSALPLYIGCRWDNESTRRFQGYIDEVRFTAGTSVLTTEVPVAPFPNP